MNETKIYLSVKDYNKVERNRTEIKTKKSKDFYL